MGGIERRINGYCSTVITVTPEHTDRLCRILNTGDLVVFPYDSGLSIGTVVKLTPKMVAVQLLESKRPKQLHKYSKDVLLVNSSDVMLYLLKK